MKYTLELKRVERDRRKKNDVNKSGTNLKPKSFVYRIVWTSVYQEPVKYAVQRSGHMIKSYCYLSGTREKKKKACQNCVFNSTTFFTFFEEIIV